VDDRVEREQVLELVEPVLLLEQRGVEATELSMGVV